MIPYQIYLDYLATRITVNSSTGVLTLQNNLAADVYNFIGIATNTNDTSSGTTEVILSFVFYILFYVILIADKIDC